MSSPTEDHRFWNATDGEWQESQDLDTGDRLLTADGDRVTVTGLDGSTVHTDDAYDLTIGDLHTYYVTVGDEAALVHNCNFTDIGSGADLIRQADIDGLVIRVKSGHGYRSGHGSVDITTVASRDEVDRAVVRDLVARVSIGATVARAGSGHSTFTTTVAGHTVEYRAVFVPATGRYEIATYYIP